MALYKIADVYPNYKEDIFAGNDIKSFSVYSENNENIGSVHDAIVDETGRFRYLVVDTGFWIFGKKVLLPIGSANIDYSSQRVRVSGLNKQQAENLPEYKDDMTIDFDYEERVRSVYRQPNQSASSAYNDQNYNYDDYDRELYQTNDQNHQNLKLYEERLIANKERFRKGAVSLGKKIETETAQVSVPVEKERVVIERKTPTDATAVAGNNVNFQEGEVARVEVYEESANISKETFVREEVSVRKEVERDSVEAKETLRREELDVDTDGELNIKNK